MNEDKIYLEQ